MYFYFHKMNEFSIIVASNAGKEIYGEINVVFLIILQQKKLVFNQNIKI